MAIGRSDRKQKKRKGDDDLDLSNASAPSAGGSELDSALQMSSFGSETSNETYLEELLDEQPDRADSPEAELALKAGSLQTGALNTPDVQLPPTILDKLVSFLARTLEDLEAKLLDNEEPTAETDEEFDLEEELKRLAYMKSLQMKAIKLQKILQMRELGDAGIFALNEPIEHMSDEEIEALIEEMKTVEDWLKQKGLMTDEVEKE